MDRWAAVVLAGGRARRLGGVDKLSLTVAGHTLLDHVLGACSGAEPVVVVGPVRPTHTHVHWTVEDPPQGGPLAALAAGLAEVPPGVPVTAVLAADLPGVRPGTLRRLHAALSDRSERVDGALLVDAGGQPQWLCGVWQTAALRRALRAAGDPANRSVRAVLAALNWAAVPAAAGEAMDVDTPQDLRAVQDR